jgi:hypothetical protein
MGFTPQQVGAMGLYQYAACVDGWNTAQGGGELAAPTDEEFEAAKQEHGLL